MHRLWFIVIFLVAAWSLPGEAASSPKKKGCRQKVSQLRTQPDLTTDSGRIQFAISLLRRHANLVRANLKFKRNLLEVLQPVADLQVQLGRNAAPADYGPSQVHRARYSSVATQYDQAKIERFIADRRQDLDGLSIDRKFDLAEQLIAFKQAATVDGKFNEKLFRKSAARLLRTAPLLYDANGKIFAIPGLRPLDLADSTILHATPAQLDNFYFDLFAQHHRPILEKLWSEPRLKMGQLKEIYGTISNQLLDRDLKHALTPLQSSGEQIRSQVLSLVSVPPEAAIYRGCYGEDCSILSVPYFPLVQGVSVHHIFKSTDTNGSPDGYVLSALVKVKGKKVPYVISAQGPSLTSVDVRAAVRLVAEAGKSEEVLLPDFSAPPHNRFLVNTEEARSGLTVAHSRTVPIELPSGWEVIDRYLAENRTRYPNYYMATALTPAKLTTLAELETHLLSPIEHERTDRPLYEPIGEIETIPLLERALFAAQASEDQTKTPKLLADLAITANHLKTAQRILAVSETTPMDSSLFTEAKRIFHFDFPDLLSLEPFARAHSLAKIYVTAPELFTEAQWNRATRQTLRELKAVHVAAEWTPETKAATLRLMNAQLALPGAESVDAALPRLLNLLSSPEPRTSTREFFERYPEKFSTTGQRQFVRAYFDRWEAEAQDVIGRGRRPDRLFEEMNKASQRSTPLARELVEMHIATTAGERPAWTALQSWTENNLSSLFRRHGDEKLRAALGNAMRSAPPKESERAMMILAESPSLLLSNAERTFLIGFISPSDATPPANPEHRAVAIRLLQKDLHPDSLKALEESHARRPEPPSPLPSPSENLSRPISSLFDDLRSDLLSAARAVDQLIYFLKQAALGFDQRKAYEILIRLRPTNIAHTGSRDAFAPEGAFTNEVEALAQQSYDPGLKQGALLYLLNGSILPSPSGESAPSISPTHYDLRTLLGAGRPLWFDNAQKNAIDELGEAFRDKPEWRARVAEYLGDTDPQVRYHALRVLAKGKLFSPEVRAKIEALTKDPYFEIQSTAESILKP